MLVEMAAGQSRPATLATAAQIWVIQEGRAKFFLGSMQARIARAGEVVRIPADVTWRLENTGAGILRAVTVKPVTPG